MVLIPKKATIMTQVSYTDRTCPLDPPKILNPSLGI